MTHRSNSYTKALLLTLFVAVGCSKGGAQGCSGDDSASDSVGASDSASVGASDSAKAASVDSKLLGVYKIDRYQGSQATCDQLLDVLADPGYLIVYGFRPSSSPGESRLGATFCADVDSCRALAGRGPEPVVGYSFLEGDDASGWKGWAIPASGATDDERCRADVQTHMLTSTTEKSIKIETTTVETVFDPRLADDDQEGNTTCTHRDAINATSTELPCKAYLILEATRESSL
jgi:hypothetical protein